MGFLKQLYVLLGVGGWFFILFLIAYAIFFSDVGFRYDKYDLELSLLGGIAWLFWAGCGYFLYFLRRNGKELIPFEMFFLFFFFLVLPGLVLVKVDLTDFHYTCFFTTLAGAAIVFIFCAYFSASKISSFPVRDGATSVLFDQCLVAALIFCSLIALISGMASLESGGFWKNAIAVTFGDGGIDDSVNIARRSIYDGDRGVMHTVRYYLTGMVIPVLAATLLYISRIKKKKIFLYVALFCLFMSIVISMSSGSRLQFARLILFVFFVFLSLGLVRPKQVFYASGVVLLLLILSTSALGRMVAGESSLETLSKALNRVAERVFLTKGASSMMGIEYTLQTETWPRYGDTYTNYFSGGSSDYFAAEVHYYIFGWPGTAGPQSLVEGYINGGAVGLLITAIGIFSVLMIMSYILSGNSLGLRYFSVLFLAFAFSYSGYSHTFSFQALGVIWGMACYFIFIFIYRIIYSVVR